MVTQIFDRKTVGIPGTVTPAVQALRDQAVAAVADAEAARDEAETFSATTVELQDAAVSELLGDSASDTNAAGAALVNATITNGLAPAAAQAIADSTELASAITSLPSAAPNTVSTIGDSITDGVSDISGGSWLEYAAWSVRGPVLAGNVLSDWTRYATGGYTLGQIRDVHLPSALASGASYITVAGGSNNAPSFNAASVVSVLNEITSMITAAGRVPIMWAPPPRGSSWSLQVRQDTAKIATIAREIAARNGWEILDAWQLLLDPATGMLNGTYDSGDGLHPNLLGHTVLARAYADVLRRVMPTPVRGWIDSSFDPALNASTGLMQDNVTPGSWSDAFVPSYGSVTNSVVPGAPFGSWQRISVAPTDTPNAGIYADVAGLVPGRKYEIRFVAEASLDAATAADFRLGINVAWRSSSGSVDDFAAHTEHPSPGMMARFAATDRMYWKAVDVCPAGADRVRVSMFTSNGIAPGGATYLQIAQYSVRDLTTLGIA